MRFLRYHAAVERHIRDLGIGYTFLRPNLFFQGLLAFAGWVLLAPLRGQERAGWRAAVTAPDITSV